MSQQLSSSPVPDLGRKGCVAGILVALLLLSALVHSNLPLFASEIFETHDFAANSLLVQQAKALDLFTGNYSRLGFHHPGPGILYVLAAGELLFHDVLAWVSSPVGGQVLGALVYNAAWSAALVYLLTLLFGSAAAAATATVIFLAATVLRDAHHAVVREGQLLVSIWMPDLYYFPFAVLLAALARLSTGHLDGLALLTLAAGFLVHGHASFLVIVPLLLVPAIGLYFLRARATHPSPGRLLRDSWSSRKVQISAALAILVLFVAPIVQQTIVRFPGPIFDYFTYSRQARDHGWIDSVHALVRYWGSLWAVSVAVVVLGIGILRPDSKLGGPHRDAALGTLAACLIATVVMLVYLRFGVDRLEHFYLGFFYMAAASLVVGVGAGVALGALPHGSAVSFVCLCIAFAVVWTKAPPSRLLGDADIPKLAQTMAGLPKPTVVDLDLSQDEDRIWGTVLGLAAHSSRSGGPRFCIAKGWHISFTSGLRCAADEEAQGYLVTATSKDPSRLEMPLISARGVTLAASSPALLPWSANVAVTSTSEPAASLLGFGWSRPEQDFTWSEGPSASLRFRVPDPGDFVLELDMMAFLPSATSAQQVSISLNGEPRRTVQFQPPDARQKVSVPVPQSLVGKRPRVVVRIDVANPVSPKAAGFSRDPRPLGVALWSIRATPARSIHEVSPVGGARR